MKLRTSFLFVILAACQSYDRSPDGLPYTDLETAGVDQPGSTILTGQISELINKKINYRESVRVSIRCTTEVETSGGFTTCRVTDNDNHLIFEGSNFGELATDTSVLANVFPNRPKSGKAEGTFLVSCLDYIQDSKSTIRCYFTPN